MTNSQVKRNGASRKQPDGEYADMLFKLATHLSEHKTLPAIDLQGRPLYKYIIKIHEKQKIGYKFHDCGK